MESAMMNTPTQIALDLLAGGDRRAMQANSFKNFHTTKARYINLVRTPAMTVKLYLIEGGEEDVINPHSHGYNFHTWLLDGQMENVVYGDVPADRVPEEPPAWTRFKYVTPLNGTPSLEPDGKTHLIELYRETLVGRASSYYLDHTLVHTIRVPEDSILLLFQYADLPLPHTLLYTSGEAPDTTGLYTKFTDDEFDAAIDEVQRRITQGAEWLL
jgi:hypothetical protein